MSSTRLLWFIATVLVVLTLAAYSQVWECGILDLDDESYLFEHPEVLDGLTLGGLQWAWTTFHGGFWFPLTWMSLQLDASLSSAIQGPSVKEAPLGLVFHGQNLFWHTATVVLLLATLYRLTGALWRSALVAALFAVHPLHVESVAWVTERKDVLSTFFWVLTLLAYGWYVERPGVGRYLLIVSSFLLGLLAKPMVVTLPCVLLLLDWWPLQRFTNPKRERGILFFPRSRFGLVWEKVPLLAISAAVGVLTVWAQQQAGAVATLAHLSFADRLANAVISYGWYLEKTVWPTNLAIFYCHPLSSWQWEPVVLSGIVLVGVTILALVSAKRWPWLVVGWLWFVGTLVPVIGLVQAGEQARADRFVYVPHIGLFIALVWSLAALRQAVQCPEWVGAAGAAVCLLLLTAVTWVQVGYWKDSETMWQHTLEVTPDNHQAHCGMGRVLLKMAESDPELTADERRQRLAEARQHFERAIALAPHDDKYRWFLGRVLEDQRSLDEAAQQREKQKQ